MVKIADVPYTPIILRYRGLFDWDGLYLAIADWLKRYRYILHEETYKHKVPSPMGAEQELRWFADIEVNDYIKFRITLDFHLWDMTEVEVVRDGKKKLLTNARMQIEMRGTIWADWQDKFEKNNFTRALRSFYHNYVIRRDLDSVYGDMLIYRMSNLHAYIKKLLDMQTAWQEYAGYLGENR